jgi:molecular chaperone HtpG
VGEETATVWESAGTGEFTVADGERSEPGTSVTLHLKPADPDDGLDDFVDEGVLRRIVRKYSDFVTHPVRLQDDKQEWSTVNSMKAIWTRPPAEVTKEELADFYRHLSHDWGEPFETLNLKAEGTFEYQGLAFIPEHAPFDLFHFDAPWGLQLYANRVMILERSKELVPRWLRFLTGVVESPDLPLNVSRELLQNDRRVRQIRGHIVKKVLGVLAEMKEKDSERYLKLWAAFGRVLKEGVPDDAETREKLAPLLLFASTADPAKLTGLDEVVGRLKDGQDAIYYLTGDSRAALEKAPHLEAFKKKGYEVLLLTDPVDELLVSALPEFKGKKLRSVGKGEVALGTEEERKQEEAAREEKAAAHKDLLSALRVALQEDVKEVRLSTRLTDSAAVLISDEHDLTPHLAQLLKQAGHEVPQGKRILEVNGDHALLTGLEKVYAADANDPRLADYARLLFEQALLAEGTPLPDPVAFTRRVVDLMVRAV